MNFDLERRVVYSDQRNCVCKSVEAEESPARASEPHFMDRAVLVQVMKVDWGTEGEP